MLNRHQRENVTAMRAETSVIRDICIWWFRIQYKTKARMPNPAMIIFVLMPLGRKWRPKGKKKQLTKTARKNPLRKFFIAYR